MKQKTAMMEAIEKWEHAMAYNVEGRMVEPYSWTELSTDLQQLLEKEKYQIIDAIEHEFIGESEYNWWSAGFNGLGDKYYNETYKQD